MTDHTPGFHAALERMAVVARVIEEETPYDDRVSRAVELGLPAEQAGLAVHLLPEACGLVVADELQIQMTDTFLIRTDEGERELRIKESDDVQAAHFLAYNLRHGGRNDLFKQIVQTSAFMNALNQAFEDKPGLKTADLAGTTFSIVLTY